MVNTAPIRSQSQDGILGREYLVEEEGPVAWHTSAVVHNSRDVAGRKDHGVTQSPVSLPRGAKHWANHHAASLSFPLPFLAGLTRHWPPAHRSRRRPSGHTCTGTGQGWAESWCSASWQALQQVGKTA